MLSLTKELGKGKERTCFLHPLDNHKVVKIVHTHDSKQMDREIDLYKQLSNNPDIAYVHFPKYYGEIKTNKGAGYVFDLIANEDGSEAKALHWYLKNGANLDSFFPQLSELRSYLLNHSIVFCNDMSYEGNILVREALNGSTKLVVIDGLGV